MYAVAEVVWRCPFCHHVLRGWPVSSQVHSLTRVAAMTMAGKSVRRCWITLAGTCLALDLTGSSTMAVDQQNSAAIPAVVGRLTELLEHASKCPTGMVSHSDRNTCDPEERSTTSTSRDGW